MNDDTLQRSTLQSAPRTFEALFKEGRFNLRMLAKALGAFLRCLPSELTSMGVIETCETFSSGTCTLHQRRRNGGERQEQE